MKQMWADCARRTELIAKQSVSAKAAWADPERKAARLKKYAETVAKKRLP